MKKRKLEVTEKTYSYKEAEDLYELVVIKNLSLNEVAETVKEDISASQLYYFLGKYSIPYDEGKCYDWFIKYKEDEIKSDMDQVYEENVLTSMIDHTRERVISEIENNTADSEEYLARWMDSNKDELRKKINKLYILNIILILAFMAYIIFA